MFFIDLPKTNNRRNPCRAINEESVFYLIITYNKINFKAAYIIFIDCQIHVHSSRSKFLKQTQNLWFIPIYSPGYYHQGE